MLCSILDTRMVFHLCGSDEFAHVSFCVAPNGFSMQIVCRIDRMRTVSLQYASIADVLPIVVVIQMFVADRSLGIRLAAYQDADARYVAPYRRSMHMTCGTMDKLAEGHAPCSNDVAETRKHRNRVCTKCIRISLLGSLLTDSIHYSYKFRMNKKLLILMWPLDLCNPDSRRIEPI